MESLNTERVFASLLDHLRLVLKGKIKKTKIVDWFVIMVRRDLLILHVRLTVPGENAI